jgi:hypothetical protein
MIRRIRLLQRRPENSGQAPGAKGKHSFFDFLALRGRCENPDMPFFALYLVVKFNYTFITSYGNAFSLLPAAGRFEINVRITMSNHQQITVSKTADTVVKRFMPMNS